MSPRSVRSRRAVLVPLSLAVWGLLSPGCLLRRREPVPEPAPPRGEPLPPAPQPPPPKDDPGPVKVVQGPIVVAAWAEPRQLPAGGGQAQIVVRVQKRGGAPLAGVEVRLNTTHGSLFSAGRVLTTDVRGMTRDRLTTRRSAVITLNAGGTRYRFQVNVDAPQ